MEPSFESPVFEKLLKWGASRPRLHEYVSDDGAERKDRRGRNQSRKRHKIDTAFVRQQKWMRRNGIMKFYNLKFSAN